MRTVGKILKESRESKRIDIRSLSKTLKISTEYIIAIEKGQINKTPGDPYTLGFVKAYSEYLDLDTELIVKIYKDETKAKNIKQTLNLPLIFITFIYSLLIFGLSSCIIVSFVVVFYNFFYLQTNIDDIYALTPELESEMIALVEEEEFKQSLNELKKYKEKQENENSYTKLNIEVIKNESLEANVKDNESIDPGSAIASVSKEKFDNIKNKIILKMLGDTWIHIKGSDEKLIISKLMKKNEEFILNSSAYYFITTGNAGNIEILINNKKYGKLGKKGEVLNSFELSPNIIDN